MRWSAEQVLDLAPDAASAKAGRGQAAPAKWSGAGASELAVWGLCQGSGKNPYQACVQLEGPAFRCSCPSRKFPCKHALGVLLLWAAGGVAESAHPDWVQSWLDERRQRAERSEKRAETAAPPDPEAARKRADQRSDRVAAGAAELSGWLADQVRAGLGSLEQRGSAAILGVAARMVDAQAPGLATGLRRAANLVGRGRDWPARLLEELALLHLLVTAQGRLAELPVPLAETVRAQLGFTVDTSAVLAGGERVTDRWLVGGLVDEEGDRLVTRRIWLHGTESGRVALVLSFAPPGRPLESGLRPGTVLPATLAFHAGALPLRAAVADRGEPEPAPPPPGQPVAAALAGYSAALAADPWLRRWPVLLSGVVPVMHGEGWALADRAGDALPLVPSADPWPLLAVSAGNQVTVAAEWSAAGVRPLSCWDSGRAVRV